MNGYVQDRASLVEAVAGSGKGLEAGVGSNLLGSTLFGKNSTLLRITLLKRVFFDKIENSNIFKIVGVREIEIIAPLKRVVV